MREEELSIIVNTAEDVEVSNLYISPDLDTVTYTLAGIINEKLWYGIKDDTFHCHETLNELGESEILKIGDIDRAFKLYRTLKLQKGETLSEVTKEICEELGIKSKLIPMTNDSVNTEIVTENDSMTFHEFWINRKAEVEVKEVNFNGIREASPAPEVIDLINESDGVLIGPSNPITSIKPIISMSEVLSALKENRDKVLAVSPIIDKSPISGPTGVLMEGLGHEVSPLGVAKMYNEFVKTLFLHETDHSLHSDIEALNMKVQFTDILMNDTSSKIKLAREILKRMKQL